MSTPRRWMPTIAVLAAVACDGGGRTEGETPAAITPMAQSERADAPSVEPPLPPPAVPMVPPAPPPDDEVEVGELDNERVIAIARAAAEVEASPEDVDVVLERHGLDRGAFEAAVAEIAKDPWKSDLYIAVLAQRGKS